MCSTVPELLHEATHTNETMQHFKIHVYSTLHVVHVQEHITHLLLPLQLL